MCVLIYGGTLDDLRRMYMRAPVLFSAALTVAAVLTHENPEDERKNSNTNGQTVAKGSFVIRCKFHNFFFFKKFILRAWRNLHHLPGFQPVALKKN